MTRILVLWLLCLISNIGLPQSFYDDLSLSDQKLYDEHIYKGQPDQAEIFVRQGYVMKYNFTYRIPEWVAYHVVPEYLKTPKREKKYKRFRKDNDIQNAVVNSDYTGSGYSRGHMAPYFAMGGDRDKNGIRANLFDDSQDPYDDLTVFQANYMSNIAPQDQNALNGPGGPWYALETKIRVKLVPELKELHLVLGGIVSDSHNYPTLTNKKGKTDIAIPNQYYQVLIYFDDEKNEHVTAAFLFPHVKEKKDLPYDDLIKYLVPIDSVEMLTGLDFFPKLDDSEEDEIEQNDNKSFWIKWF